jgi:hypothetical protein
VRVDSATGRVIELAKERLPDIVALALQRAGIGIDTQADRVLFTEEKDTLAAVQSFRKRKNRP